MQKRYLIRCQSKKPKIKFIGSLRSSSHKELFQTPVQSFPDQYITEVDNTVMYNKIKIEEYGRSFRAVLTFDQKTLRKKMFTWAENMKIITDEIGEFIRSKLNINK